MMVVVALLQDDRYVIPSTQRVALLATVASIRLLVLS